MPHACYLCGQGSTTFALCTTCVDDLQFLGTQPPADNATREEVIAWATENHVTVFSCGGDDLDGP